MLQNLVIGQDRISLNSIIMVKIKDILINQIEFNQPILHWFLSRGEKRSGRGRLCKA